MTPNRRIPEWQRVEVAAKERKEHKEKRKRSSTYFGDTLFAKLKDRLRATFVELKELLNPMGERFIAYGFNKPGAVSLPEVPTNVSAVLVGNNAIAVKWNSAARAKRYRVYAQIIGVNAEPVLLDTREDLDFVIENLPASTVVEIAVSAINNGGESAPSPVISVTTLA